MLMALGYGGLLGIVPAAIKLVFGSEHLGGRRIYGLLYFWVYIAVLLWGRLAQVPSGCAGVACYRTYCAGGAVCTFLTGVACCWMLWEDERSRRGHASRRAAPAETPRFPSRGST
ncbi:unnamed protein product [Prorocentrum cordatum]|uniref:Uncharacterized protein n=1 Tax=Prorocentrum cordatum TaxID=2364126 RepID=A0ABN9RCL4_9DINO|nr:unnamed protein product [Polarella glacialis]